MSLLDVIAKKKDEGKRVCVVCGREATGGCGLCYRDALEAAEQVSLDTGKPAARPPILTLCAVDVNPECSNRHAREKHGKGLVGETDPQWPGPK